MATVEENSIPAPLQPRYRSLDLWRGVACLMVVIYHASLYSLGWREGSTAGIYHVLRQGYLGVPLFFVISGYCIAATSDAHRRSNRPGWVFIQRRIRRIYPPFWIMTACLLLLVVIFGLFGSSVLLRRPCPLTEVASLTPLQWVGNLTLTETWLHHLGPNPDRFVNAVSWSLCYEEQFYLLCFLAIVLARRHFFHALAGLTLAVTAVWLWAVVGGWQNYISGTFLDYGWWQFACGAGVYWRLNHVRDPAVARRMDRIIFPGCAGLLALFVFLAMRYRGSSWIFVNPWLGLIVALSFAMALIGLRHLDGRIAGSRVGAVLTFVGGFSYSLYLTHMPVCKLMHIAMQRMGFWSPGRALVGTIPVTVLVSVLVGWAFYRLIEKRFLNPPLSSRGPKGIAEPQTAARSRGCVELAPCEAPVEAVICTT